jgi:hypothetical protein
MSPNHETVNEALAIAQEGYNESARPIEATRFARIAELLKHRLPSYPEPKGQVPDAGQSKP